MQTEQNTGGAKKAGILLHGPDADGKEQWLVGYSEGRFAFDGEHYMPVKGKVELGQDELDAALQELGEETGLWLAKQLSAEQLIALRQGKDLTNVTLPDYPGAIITRFHATPHRSTYVGRGNFAHSLAMFDVQIEGIEHIRGLKNSEGITTKEYMAAHPELPDFRTRLKWLIDGGIPAADGTTPLVDAQWFQGLLKQYAPALLQPDQLHGAALRDVWKAFNTEIEQNHYPEYVKLSKAYGTIKKHAKNQGWIGNDGDVIKLDLNDSPLYWCVEGARFAEPHQVLAKMFYDMAINPDYNEAVGGLSDLLGRVDPVERVLASQLTGVVWRAKPREIEGGLGAAIAVNGGKQLSWMNGPDNQIMTPVMFARQIAEANQRRL